VDILVDEKTGEILDSVKNETTIKDGKYTSFLQQRNDL
jgi:hypothetical protein